MRAVLAACWLIAAAPVAAQSPAVLRWAADTKREAQGVWGIYAPTPAFLAQIQQESGGDPKVCSPYACGLTQFTPDTARWIAGRYTAELGTDDPVGARFDPRWAIRALVRYDKHLYDSVTGRTPCDRMWGALRAYNGGLGHWRREQKLSADPLNRSSVDSACGKASRSVKHCAESLGYPRRILIAQQPRYTAWGATIQCEVNDVR